MTKLFNKYTVIKTDGTSVDPNAEYFVLRLDTDATARFAALQYALKCKDRELGNELICKLEILNNTRKLKFSLPKIVK